MAKEQDKHQGEINALKYEVDLITEQITKDEQVFIKIANNKKRRVEHLGKNRLKMNMYNPDGTTKELYSFYDEAEGSAANYKNMTDAFTELAG